MPHAANTPDRPNLATAGVVSPRGGSRADLRTSPTFACGRRVLVAAAVICTLAIVGTDAGLTAAARADNLLTGTYTVITPGASESTWTIQSSCTYSCVAVILSTDGWRGYAELRDDTWEMSVYRGGWIKSSYPVDIATCPAGVITNVVQNWSWAHDTLAGTLDTVRGNQCGGPPSPDHVPMKLVKAA